MTVVESGIVDQELRLEWTTICSLAVRALISGKDFNDMVVEALEKFLGFSPEFQKSSLIGK